MANTNLFDACLELTLDGIKEMKLCAKLENGDPISFPIDVVLKSGSTSTIVGSVTGGSIQLVTIGGQTMQFVEPKVVTSSFEEVKTEDRRGKYYTQTIDFQFSRVDLYTNNQIKDFLFSDGGELAIANAVAIIKDSNDIQWIMGYDLPMVVENFEDTTGGGDNLYSMTLVGRSYDRIRLFEEI